MLLKRFRNGNIYIYFDPKKWYSDSCLTEAHLVVCCNPQQAGRSQACACLSCVVVRARRLCDHVEWRDTQNEPQTATL